MELMDSLEIENYRRLAVKIVEVACADYIDALIVRQRGYLSQEQMIKLAWKNTISYGQRRYVYRGKDGLLKRRTESANRYALLLISEALDSTTKKERAEFEIRDCERFFHGKLFALAMPNTDPDGLIRLLKQRARHYERLGTGYNGIF